MKNKQPFENCKEKCLCHGQMCIVEGQKFINWIDRGMFYSCVTGLVWLLSLISLPLFFDIYDKGIWLYVSILSLLIGFGIALIWGSKFEE